MTVNHHSSKGVTYVRNVVFFETTNIFKKFSYATLKLLDLHFVTLYIRTNSIATVLFSIFEKIEQFSTIKTLVNINNCYSK